MKILTKNQPTSPRKTRLIFLYSINRTFNDTPFLVKKMLKKALFALLAIVAVLPFSTAQTTSKAKSKDKIAEKGRENRNVRVRNCSPINSPNLDFSPAFYQNGLVYVSSKKKAGPVDPSLGETFFELYFAPFDPNQEPAAPSRFSMALNSAQHEGPVTFSADGNTIFFTRNNESKSGAAKADKKGVIRMKIFEAQRGAFDWENVRELPFNADEHSCIHPSLSADGLSLFFASDMPGGFGGMDIWRAKREAGGGWSRPENLGSAVNSEANEAFPFAHARGNLFFSSNREGAMGGLDIFMARPDAALNGHFDEVVNLGAPFNSTEDDLGFILEADGRRGFFSSSRSGGYGKDDIFSFETGENGIEGMEKAASRRTGLEVVDAITGAGLQGAAIRVLQREKDGYLSGGDFYEPQLIALSEDASQLELRLIRKNERELGQPDLFSNARGGAQFDFLDGKDYLILVSKEGYRTAERLFSVSTSGLEAPKIALEPTPACRPIQGTVKREDGGAPISNAIVRFFDQKSTREEMVRTNSEGFFDACLAANGDWMLMAEKQGFVGKTASISLAGDGKIVKEIKLTTAPTGQVVEQTPMLGAKKLEVGSTITMEKIYYDFNQARHNADAIRQLNTLAAVMKRYPTLEIDLISHTDSKGSAEANQKLSDERAKNAKDYLVKAGGVAATRINAYGKGESQLKNRCADGSNCTEDEHGENRRTEIKIRKLAEGVQVVNRQ